MRRSMCCAPFKCARYAPCRAVPFLALPLTHVCGFQLTMTAQSLDDLIKLRYGGCDVKFAQQVLREVVRKDCRPTTFARTVLQNLRVKSQVCQLAAALRGQTQTSHNTRSIPSRWTAAATAALAAENAATSPAAAHAVRVVATESAAVPLIAPARAPVTHASTARAPRALQHDKEQDLFATAPPAARARPPTTQQDIGAAVLAPDLQRPDAMHAVHIQNIININNNHNNSAGRVGLPILSLFILSIGALSVGVGAGSEPRQSERWRSERQREAARRLSIGALSFGFCAGREPRQSDCWRSERQRGAARRLSKGALSVDAGAGS